MGKGLLRLFMALVMVFGIIAIIPVYAYATEGIKNNGLGGISIDIDDATYDDLRWSAYGNPYGTLGCMC